MAISGLANGMVVEERATVLPDFQTVTNTLGNLSTVFPLVRVNTFGRMATSILECSQKEH
jgi:hypothetical protein